jgi:tRNA 5-methylaminomethyl-2-thiouridine biosynthesis bifunctional protein
MVQALLRTPGITLRTQADVGELVADGRRWRLLDSNGNDLGTYEQVVLANAVACSTLLRKMAAGAPASPQLMARLSQLQAVHGTLSHGTYAEDIPGLPAHPLNGQGCFLPRIPGTAGVQWMAGSTFEADAQVAADLGAQHLANMQRLRQLLPAGEIDIADVLDRGPVSQWSATRCVTHDRLPLVGPVDEPAKSGLWLCVGMGSRGLSFSALCAELLAARLCCEPLPMEARLARSLDVHRPQRQRAVPPHLEDE